MLDKEDLQAIAQLIQQSVSSLRTEIQEQNANLKAEISNLDKKTDEQNAEVLEKISHMQEDINTLKEDSAITRNGVNTILEWADDPSKQEYPLFGKKAN